jgi:hypothetical protein
MKSIGLLLLAICLLNGILNATPTVRAEEVRPQRILIQADPPTNPAYRVVYDLERQRQCISARIRRMS